jgi:hypothetical protein
VKELLKKHGKIIMTIVSVALMFVFAMPAFQQNRSRTDIDKEAVGWIDGKKVSRDDLARASAELQILQEFGFLPPGWIENQSGEDNQPAMYWILVTKEAERYAYNPISPEAAVTQAVENLKQKDPSIDAAKVNDRLQSEFHNANSVTLAQVVSRFQMFLSYRRMLSNMPVPVSQMELSADRELRKVEVQYVPVAAARDWQKIPDARVTPEQLKTQFEAYKDTLATPIPVAPQDAPYFLGLDQDDIGLYALIGYPDDINNAAHVHQNEIIPWDGSKVEQILGQGFLVLSGGGRPNLTPVQIGMDLHGQLIAPLPPEINGHHFPFGYKQPDRVKIEYLAFNKAELRKRLTPTAAMVDLAFKEFKARPFKFRPDQDPAKAATQPASITVSAPNASQPATATAPAPRDPKDILKDYDNPKVKQPYIDEQLDASAATLLKKMVDAARSKAEAPWKTEESLDKSAWTKYEKIAADLGKDPAFFGYQPKVANTGSDFLGAEELKNVPGIGRSVYTAQNQMFGFAVLATDIRELFSPEITKRLTAELKREPTTEEIIREIRKMPLGRLSVQMGVEPQADLYDKDGNMYLFRATDCQPAHVPVSLDDKTIGTHTVREDVLADCKKLATYQQNLKDVQAALEKGDMSALATQYQSKVYSPKLFNRDVNAAPVEVANIRNFVNTAFDLPDPDIAKKPSFTTLEDGQYLRLYPLKLVRVQPTTGDDFAASRLFLLRQRQGDTEVAKFLRQYLSFDELSARLKYSAVGGPSKKSTTKP